jgi:hypothetical protein
MDGSEMEFEWGACINGRNWRNDTLGGFREAIDGHIDAFKQAGFRRQQRCPVSQKVINPLNSHVDHRSPKTLNFLVCMFLKQYGAELSGVAVENLEGAMHIKDEKLKRAWSSFYKREAQLRLVHRDVPYQK